jgi:hypothetical protein
MRSLVCTKESAALNKNLSIRVAPQIRESKRNAISSNSKRKTYGYNLNGSSSGRLIVGSHTAT